MLKRPGRDQLALREKAIGEYQRILTQFPGTPAAKTAALRLKELGVAMPAAASTAALPTSLDACPGPVAGGGPVCRL